MTEPDPPDEEPWDPWSPWEQGDQGPAETPVPEVATPDDGPVGILYGPDGEVLTVVHPPRLPFGFVP